MTSIGRLEVSLVMNAVLDDRLETLAREPFQGIRSLLAVLGQLRQLLLRMTDEQYVTNPADVISSSVGGHVRHCLDHVESLLSGVDTGELNYDHRQRGTDVETCRPAALRALVVLEAAVQKIARLPASYPLQLEVLLASNGPSVVVDTSLGRELVFVMSHTIHHNALIGVIARRLGVRVPERFGYAPSTLSFMDNKRCAR
jgi:uncharacterized damage-inducible protein DinB